MRLLLSSQWGQATSCLFFLNLIKSWLRLRALARDSTVPSVCLLLPPADHQSSVPSPHPSRSVPVCKQEWLGKRLGVHPGQRPQFSVQGLWGGGATWLGYRGDQGCSSWVLTPVDTELPVFPFGLKDREHRALLLKVSKPTLNLLTLPHSTPQGSLLHTCGSISRHLPSPWQHFHHCPPHLHRGLLYTVFRPWSSSLD